MAVSEHNVITKGATGTFAKQIVFRQRNGKTVMCNRPCKYPPKTPTQIANQERFKRANDFAKAAVKDPAKKAFYKSIAKPNQTAFNAAFQDAYHKPEVIASVKEQTIEVEAKGKHRITSVKVAIENAAGTEKRTGFAIKKVDLWEFDLGNIEKGESIRLWVHDIAGNIVQKKYRYT
ncbi:hypothetical protein GFS24_15035 [Chitinophaga sp. SYP-B3965]|uniref:hypothetical protein n=1 Tax=Chitinophaga sp. SYP-B3965 TaxID=2663120 RepID=UPI001299BC10|nr:hypothetical protein [Chitinophaga sp. SYP-B3965]MRG46435.1 hypothetical protein [Chitinophaga sp. SYP-B3965]